MASPGSAHAMRAHCAGSAIKPAGAQSRSLGWMVGEAISRIPSCLPPRGRSLARASADDPGRRTKFGFLGLGIMGKAMALNLLKQGTPLTVWNRSPPAIEELLEQSAAAELAAVADSAESCVAQCDVVFSMLSDPEAVRSVFLDSPAVLLARDMAGKAIIDCSTIDPKTTEELQAAVQRQGGEFLAAPVSGSKGPAESGQLIFICAGSRALFDRTQRELDIMGKKAVYLGDSGALASAMKLVVNMVMGCMMKALAEGLSLAEDQSLDPHALLDILSAGALANPMFALKGPAMIDGAYPAQFPLKHLAKDMRLAVELAEGALEGEFALAKCASRRYTLAEDDGLADLDFSAIKERA